MTRLRNLRRVEGRHGPEMHADFTAADGRMGCVNVTLTEYEAHGEALLMEQARARLAQVRRDGYVPPEDDRFRELG